MVDKRGRGQPPKPPELKRKAVTLKLPPELITRLRMVDNQSRLIEKLLIEYFEKAS